VSGQATGAEVSGIGAAGKPRNVWLVWLVWPVLTLGIYHLVWWYKINNEARRLDSRIEVSPAVSVLALIPGFVLIVPPYVSIWRTGSRIRQMQVSSGFPGRCSPLIGLILSFFLGLHALYYQAALNDIWRMYGDPPAGTRVSLRF
jgi:hypothetical protein